MLKWGHEYVDKGLQYYEERHRQQQVHVLKKRAARLGLQIVEPPNRRLISFATVSGESVMQVVYPVRSS